MHILHMPQHAVKLVYTGSSFAPKFSVSAGKTIKLLWGDGQATTITGAVTDQTYTHNYAASGTYQFRIIGDLNGVMKFRYNLSALSGDISTIRYLTSLIYLSLSNTSISGDISNLSGMISLTKLYLYNTSISGDISNLSGLVSLIGLSLYNTSVSGDISNLSGLISLVWLYLYNTSIDTYTQGVLPDWNNCDIYIQDLGLSQQEVDDFLCDLNTASSASTKVLNISGTNAAPSATGLACKDNDPNGLVAKGWTVTVSA